MFKPFRTAAVLGAGVMGSQIAAHLANAGMIVYLLDLPTPAAQSSAPQSSAAQSSAAQSSAAQSSAAQSSSPRANKNHLVETLFKKATQLTPPIFFSNRSAERVILGNYEDDWDKLSQVDWVIEAVVENLKIKQQLLRRVAEVVRCETVVSTNTSGLPLATIIQGLPESILPKFLGTHFFNPPRYLKLLELIPTPHTELAVLERMRWFGELHLGKGVVIAKDTPNFIANRIGVFATMQGLRSLEHYSIEEIDTLTGPLVGRPKSATFRTADLVGLDTMLHVATNLYPAIPQDESRHLFQVPALLRQLVETGTLGAKTRQGFYKKQGADILSINPATLAYEPAKAMDLPGVAELMEQPLPQRLRSLYHLPGRAGDWFRSSTRELLAYSLHRIPEIADSPEEIDRAMRWGFSWQVGPFELWQILGYREVMADLQGQGVTMPDWVLAHSSFYPTDTGITASGELSPASLHHFPIVWQNTEAVLRDIGDRVVLYEFRSKGNTLSAQVVQGLSQVLDLLETGEYEGLVIGNSSDHFCGGANLMEMGGLAQAGDAQGLANMLLTFQSLMQRLKYFPKPVVSAVVGKALGGGCELVMASPHVVAAAESYIGLVELGVGLIPGAGGLMRMAAHLSDRTPLARTHPKQLYPLLQGAFETIGKAQVSQSAEDAQQLGFLPCDAVIVMDRDRLLAVAKSEVLRLAQQGYRPPTVHHQIQVLGREARAMLEHRALVMQEAGWISEYDRYLAGRLAYVLSGGDLTTPALVHEDYLLQLEREVFLPLLAQPKTQDRIRHLLMTKKPLRN
jgi:3-hydroxyacyl-CoA dehydrogenase